MKRDSLDSIQTANRLATCSSVFMSQTVNRMYGAVGKMQTTCTLMCVESQHLLALPPQVWHLFTHPDIPAIIRTKNSLIAHDSIQSQL